MIESGLASDHSLKKTKGGKERHPCHFSLEFGDAGLSNPILPVSPFACPDGSAKPVVNRVGEDIYDLSRHRQTSKRAPSSVILVRHGPRSSAPKLGVRSSSPARVRLVQKALRSSSLFMK
jgi:hypothetical protein